MLWLAAIQEQLWVSPSVLDGGRGSDNILCLDLYLWQSLDVLALIG
jgi:hypothetical protein